MKSNNVIFVGTGITGGDILNGVKFYKNIATADSIVLRSRTKPIRRISTQHNIAYKTIPLESTGAIKYLDGLKRL
ncbi:fructose-bisphosphatase class II [Fervidobacterium thailandense]